MAWFMKTLAQVQADIGENNGKVYTLYDFINLIDIGVITEYDGIGMYHDGEIETDVRFGDTSVDLDFVLDHYPYVVWYNK